MQIKGEADKAPANDMEIKIPDFVARDILFTEQGFPHNDDASLLQTGTIDSLGVLELVTFVGREIGLVVKSSEVTPETLDSLSRLSAFIRKKQGKTQEGCVGS